MKKGYIFILLSTVLFSTMEIALNITSNTDSFNPVELTFLRFFIGALVLLAPAVISLKKHGCKLKLSDAAFFALTGFICVVISMVIYQFAILYAPASVVAVLFSCNPVFVALFAFFLLHEKIYRHTILSIAVSLLGILVIMNPLGLSGSFRGIAFTLIAAVTFALYGVIGRTRTERYGGIALTCFSFLAGSAEMFLFILLTHIQPIAKLLLNAGLKPFAAIPILEGINLHSLPGLIYIGIFVTGLGYAFYFLAMESTSAITASLVFFIKPALAPVLALLILREPITLEMAAGILLILLGSLITFIPGIRLAKKQAATGRATVKTD